MSQAMRKALSSRDLKVIKKNHEIDLYQFSMDAATGDGKMVPDQETIEAICSHKEYEDWENRPFSECIEFAMDTLAETFGGKAEKK